MLAKTLIFFLFGVIAIAFIARKRIFAEIHANALEDLMSRAFVMALALVFGIAGYYLTLFLLLFNHIDSFSDIGFVLTHSPFHFGWTGMLAIFVGFSAFGVAKRPIHLFRFKPAQPKKDELLQGRNVQSLPPSERSESLLAAQSLIEKRQPKAPDADPKAP